MIALLSNVKMISFFLDRTYIVNITKTTLGRYIWKFYLKNKKQKINRIHCFDFDWGSFSPSSNTHTDITRTGKWGIRWNWRECHAVRTHKLLNDITLVEIKKRKEEMTSCVGMVLRLLVYERQMNTIACTGSIRLWRFSFSFFF